MDNDLISVVVPVYNVEKYLNKCVDSIINQTYKKLEIILVDDGSSDTSGEKCDEYLKKDSRIKVYHKKNGGLSDARNYGIDKANGKYIGFVDSDDFIKDDMYAKLYNAIKIYDADVSMCRVIDCYGEIPPIDNSNVQTILLNSHDAIKKVMEAEDISVHAVSKLYKRKIFDDIKFEKDRTTEDGIIMIELLDKCSKIAYVNSIEYFYIHRKNSITSRKFSERNYDVIYAYKKNAKIINQKYTDLSNIAQMRLCWAYFNVLDNMIKSNYPIDKDILNYLRGKTSFILKCPYFTKNRKMLTIILKININLYRILIKKFSKKYME